MNINNLFTKYIADVWQDAQKGKISWNDCNIVLSHLHDALMVMQAEKRYVKAIWFLAMIAWERDQMDKTERRQMFLARSYKYLLEG